MLHKKIVTKIISSFEFSRTISKNYIPKPIVYFDCYSGHRDN